MKNHEDVPDLEPGSLVPIMLLCVGAWGIVIGLVIGVLA